MTTLETQPPTPAGMHPDEWQARVQLAACYRIFDLLGWTEMIYNHITLRVPESVSGAERHFLINPFGLHYSEVTASNLVKIDAQGRVLDGSPYPVNPAGFVVHAAIHEGLQNPLAVAAPTRLLGLADVPTFAEIGVPNYELRIWTGVLAPVGTPKDLILKLNAAVRDILGTPEIRQEIDKEGGQAGGMTPEAFQTFLSADRVHWRELVDESGVPKVM